MSSNLTYSGTAGRPDRTKAIAAVILVHALLAAIILNGLNAGRISRAVEQLTTIAIIEPPPPPRPPPPRPPARKPQQMKKAAGAPAKKAEASPIVAPRPRLPVPSPLRAARIAGAGSAAASGAGSLGNGTGAGGSGYGPGGGGFGDYSRFTPARRISKIPDYEYGRLSSTGVQGGRIGVTILVNRDGSVSNCRIASSSGYPAIDGLMCQLTVQYVRFLPARDPNGRPVAQDITFFPDWHRR